LLSAAETAAEIPSVRYSMINEVSIVSKVHEYIDRACKKFSIRLVANVAASTLAFLYFVANKLSLSLHMVTNDKSIHVRSSHVAEADHGR